ncbi:MAG: proton-conducting transporter membrane subunit [Candidatus Tyrphobacter sp.]
MTLSPLGVLFSCVTLCVAIPTAVYSLPYLRRYPTSSRIWFSLAYLITLAGIVGIFAAQNIVAFLIAWEVMTLSSSALAAFEWRKERAVKAAVLMLVTSEFGTLAVLLAFALAAAPAHSLQFAAIAANASRLSPIVQIFIVLLSFFGFGVKAGVLPFNAWLPRAHPEAPANVSALLSGVILNCGLYGMLLVNLVLVPQGLMLFGWIALGIGALSAIVGILYATVDDDLKRMLAFSSIENVGIIAAAFGAGAIFLAMHQLELAALGIGAGLWHMTNHSLYKALLFLGAGSVDRAAGTRRMNALGGLARALPITAACFFVGALAIAAIPPLNGFASEWLTLETLLRSAEIGPVAFKIGFVLAGALLALTAALAVTCFVKAYAMTFLGVARSDAARDVRGELGTGASVGMGLLALLCIVTGLFPAYVVRLIDAALPAPLNGQLLRALVPAFLVPGGAGLPHAFLRDFGAIGARIGAGHIPGPGLVLLHRGGAANPVVFAMSSTYLAAFALILLLALIAVRTLARRRARTAAVWAGGLRPLLPEMTYTATGFSNAVRVIFEAIFHPRTVEHSRDAVAEHFRVAITRERENGFLADRLAIEPLVRKVRSYANDVARLHHGRLEGYVLYTLAALAVVLLAEVFLA